MIISSLSPSLARVGEERALETRGWTHPNEATLCELRLGGNSNAWCVGWQYALLPVVSQL
jgi:hypothetical protein